MSEANNIFNMDNPIRILEAVNSSTPSKEFEMAIEILKKMKPYLDSMDRRFSWTQGELLKYENTNGIEVQVQVALTKVKEDFI